MGKGLYGQLQGNEFRSDFACLSERISDNQIVEGEIVATLQRMFHEQNWTQFNAYIAQIKQQGFSKARIDSIVRRATFSMRI